MQVSQMKITKPFTFEFVHLNTDYFRVYDLFILKRFINVN